MHSTQTDARSSTEITWTEGCLVPRTDVSLEYGGRLSDYRVGYALVGRAGAPVVGVLGGISADRRVSSRGHERGWWDAMVGRGRPVDLDAWRVLSIDYLGGPGDTVHTGESRGRRTSAPEEVPLLTPRDQGAALAAVAEETRLAPLHGVIGASYGGAVALALAADRPDLVRGALVISAAHRSHPLATAVRTVQRRIVRRSIAAGDVHGGLSLARALAMTTYRSAREFEERFAGPPRLTGRTPRFPVESYLDHHGEKFARRFTAAEFLCLSRSLDLHAVRPGSVRAPVTLVTVDPDFLAPRWQMEDLARQLPGRHRVARIESRRGHDAFLTDDEAFAPIVTAFLSNPELES